MKKLSLIVMLFMTLSLPMTFISCGDDDGDKTENPGDNPGGGDEPINPGESMDVAQQKQKLESTAMELMNKINAADFKNIADVVGYAAVTSQNGDVVEEWAESCARLCVQSTSDQLIKMLYQASNFYGQFELQNGKWIKTGSERGNVQFKFKDGANNDCLLTLTYSENGTKVHHESFDEEDWEYYYNNGNYYEIRTRIENTYVIPEKMEVTLTQGGTKLVDAVVTSALSITDASGEFNFNTDKAEVTANIKVNNYSVVVDKAAFNAGTSASLSAKFMKDNETLISLAMTGTGNLSDIENPVANDVTLDLDLIGKVQLKGKITEISKMKGYMQEAYSNAGNESAFKESVNKMNQLMDVNMFFDGNDTKRASIKYYPFIESGYGSEEWYVEPVMMFPDGSGYSTMQSYFDATTFATVITKFSNLINDFMGLTDLK